MPLTHEQTALVRWSFDKLKVRMEPASVYFYDDLFRRSPDLRKLFRDDLAGQGMKFMSTLGTLIESLDNPDAMAEDIIALGELHERMGIKPHMFRPMEEALISTMRHVLDGDLTADVESAWRAAFDEVSGQMMADDRSKGRA